MIEFESREFKNRMLEELLRLANLKAARQAMIEEKSRRMKETLNESEMKERIKTVEVLVEVQKDLVLKVGEIIACLSLT